MGRAIDAIRAASALERRKLVVPEWGGLEVWIRKITVRDVQAVRALAEGRTDEQNVHLLCRVAEDEAGQPLFQSGDVDELLNRADYNVVAKVIEFIFTAHYPTVEAAIAAKRQEIESDPTSASATP